MSSRAGTPDAPVPLVSIGLPVFNGGRLLGRALESLLSQTQRDLELVVSDNCSSDETRDVCSEFAARDSRVRYSRNASNVGVVRNFEATLKGARGKYFMWAAHDDAWSPDYVERLVDRLESMPGAVLAAGRAEFVDAGGDVLVGVEPSAAPGPSRPWLDLMHSHATHWIYGVFAREALLDLAPALWRHRPWGGDFVWLLQVATSAPVLGDERAVIRKALKPSPYQPAVGRETAEWQIWYAKQIVRQIVGSGLPRAEKLRALRHAAGYWWKLVNDPGYGGLGRTWLAALGQVATGRRRTRAHGASDEI